jgi:hypothetical protein
MAECPSCNAQVKDGDWTCGTCGAPVAGAGMPPAPGPGQYGGEATASIASGRPAYDGPGQWGPEHTSQPAAAAPAASHPSGLLKLVVVGAVVAVIAIVLVWFFLLRATATSGEEFLGVWKATSAQGITTLTVETKGDAFSVTMTGGSAGQTVTVPAHVDGDDLVITMDDFSEIAGEKNADAFEATLRALAGDFRMIFSSVDATHVDLRIVGTSPGGEEYDETIPLTRETAGTT